MALECDDTRSIWPPNAPFGTTIYFFKYIKLQFFSLIRYVLEDGLMPLTLLNSWKLLFFVENYWRQTALIGHKETFKIDWDNDRHRELAVRCKCS